MNMASMTTGRSAARLLVALVSLCLLALAPGLGGGCDAQTRHEGAEGQAIGSAPQADVSGIACTAVPHQSYVGHTSDCDQTYCTVSATCTEYCGQGCTSQLLGRCLLDATSPNNYSYLCECGAGGASPGPFSPGRSTTVPTSGSVWEIAAGDLDGDGLPDIALSHDTGDLGIVRNLGGIHLGSEVLYTIPGHRGTGLQIADLNKDGANDVVVADYGPDYTGGALQIFYGHPGGTLDPAVTVGTGGVNPIGVRVADLDGDTLPDLVASHNNGDWSVRVLRQSPLGTFQVAGIYPGGQNPHSLALADFNGDGTTDVAVGVYWNGLFVYQNDGAGALLGPAVYAQPYHAFILAADFDGDGRPDIAARGSAGSGVSDVIVYHNGGAGTFPTSKTFSVDSDGGFPAAGDFDGDGHIDLAVPNTEAATVSVLLNDGAGGFLPRMTLPTRANPRSAVVADFDGDGHPDIAVAGEDACGGWLTVFYQGICSQGNDGVQDGDETDVDCGGSCPSCPANAACNVNADCLSGICQGHVCVAPGANGLVLWSRLGSAADVTHPTVGPAGIFGNGSFGPGVFGDAYVVNWDQIDPATAASDTSFPSQVVPTRRGAIELWAKLTGFPAVIPWANAPGFFGYSKDVANPTGPQDYRFRFTLMLNGNDGNFAGGLTAWASNGNAGTGCFYNDYTYADILGDVGAWHHYALVWDVNGVPGAGNIVQIYLDGVPHGTSPPCAGAVAPSTLVSVPGARMYLAISQIQQGEVALDNIKIWSYSKTDFSDRFSEAPQ